MTEEEGEDLSRYQITIKYDGNVRWLYPRITTSFCKLNMRYFPWDQQVCSLKYGSWSYDGTKLDIVNHSIGGDTSLYSSNGEWDLIGMPVRRNVLTYSCCPEPYPDLTFYVILRRRSLYYKFNLVMPTIFFVFTSVLVFILPAESGEKITLSVSVLVAFTVFLLLVAESVPPQSEYIPLIGKT